jgi:hypothetical protein
VATLADSYELEHFIDACVVTLTGKVHFQSYILPHGEVIEQIAALEQNPDRARAETGSSFLVTTGETLAIDVDEAAVGLVEPSDARHESRFPAAGWTDDSDDLAGIHLHANAAQRLCLVVADVVEAVQLARFDRGLHGGGECRAPRRRRHSHRKLFDIRFH